MESHYFQMIGNLIIVLLLISIAALIIKRVKPYNKIKDHQLNIINQMRIGSKEKIILIEANNKFILLGATPTHIQTLHIFNSLEDVNINESFDAILRTANE